MSVHTYRVVGTAVVGILGVLLSLIPASSAYAVETRPGVPEALRISNGPYQGFQFCGFDPVATTSAPHFAASPTVAEGYPPPGMQFPNLRGTFQLARPGQPPFIRLTAPLFNYYTLLYQPPLGTLSDGAYRWRLRAVDITNGQVSDWTPWCAFTVRNAGA